MTVFECYLPNAVIEKVNDDETNKSLENKEIVRLSETKQPIIEQVSICFVSPELSKRVFDRLSSISQNNYRFVLGPSPKSTIVFTDSREIATELPVGSVRPLLMSSLSDDEIVRRAPIRLGIKG